MLLWQRYDNNKMVAMRYFGNVMTTTMSQYSDDVSSVTHAGCICAPVNAITTCIYFTHRSDHTKTSYVSYDFHIAGNGLYTTLVTTLKDSKTSKHVSILCQL